MDSLIVRLFWHNKQRKAVAFLTALIIWFFVNHSITETKMIRNVPIRITNLPADKTVIGLLPNGILQKRINLTLTGTKDAIVELEPGDLEVSIDASAIDHRDWIVQIGKKNLVSLNPKVDITNDISSVTHSEFVIKLNRLISADIPVKLLPPLGSAPSGYQFLDIWPQELKHTVTGPEEEVKKLKASGLQLQFNLDNIVKSDLDNIKSAQQQGSNNEINYYLPSRWKQITIPFRNNTVEEIDDPEAGQLRLSFLRQEFLPLEREIPLTLHFTPNNYDLFNPETLQFAETAPLLKRKGIFFLDQPLYVKNVSKLFLDIVRDYLKIVIVVVPESEREILPWDLEITDFSNLEDVYVAYQVAQSNQLGHRVAQQQEELYRKRFRKYSHKMGLYLSPEHKLAIESKIDGDKIIISEY